MAQAEAQGAVRGNSVVVWIFRILIVAAAAFMLYSWFQPWWSAKVSAVPGDNHMVMHPWGVDVVPQIRANADESLYSMPWIFTPFMWTYLAVCMLALAISLFTQRRLSLGRIKIPVAALLVGFVGVSYLIAVILAYYIGDLKAGWAGAKFVGSSQIRVMGGNKIRMVADLLPGYQLALYAGGALTVVAILRLFLGGRPRA